MFKAMAYPAGILLVAGAAMTLLDTYFDLTLLAVITGWLLFFRIGYCWKRQCRIGRC